LYIFFCKRRQVFPFFESLSSTVVYNGNEDGKKAVSFAFASAGVASYIFSFFVGVFVASVVFVAFLLFVFCVFFA